MPIAPLVEADVDSGPRGQYRKTAITRARILDAALEVFGESGYESGSLREVAKKADISQAGLLHHFSSKVALLSAVLERRDDQANQQVADPHASGIDQLAGLIEYARESARRPGEIDLFAVLSAEATREDHPAHDYMRRRYGWVSERIVSAFSQARASGHLRAGVNPSRAASQFIALWDGLQIQWLLRINEVNVAQGLEEFINLYLTHPLSELVAELEKER